MTNHPLWKKHRRRASAAGALLLCCALGVSAWAAEDSEPPDQPTAADTEEIDPGTSPDIEAAAEAQVEEGAEPPPGESPEIFIPTEDISESIAVKFPVDI